jgi:hypothetical protein
MATASKRILSGSTNGKPIKVVATATLGTTIHTAVAGTTAGTYDEVWLWAYNGHTTTATLTIEFGGATVPDQNIILTLAAKTGLTLVVPGLILQNGLVVTAFADVANVVTLSGFINAITD